MSADGQRCFNPIEASGNERKCNETRKDPYTQYIESLFLKKWNLSCALNYDLPDAELCFKSNPWLDSKLEELKHNLNKCKSQLNDFEIEQWSCHTRKRNPAGEVNWRLRQEVNPEFLTQAWTKFYECASMYDIIPMTVVSEKKLVSLHLCEAPGAFITSLNHFLHVKFGDIEWQWRATTLNPYYEGNSPFQMICDVRFMVYTLDKWTFGADNTGDIMNLENSNHIIQNIKSLGKVMLVTADGSIDCMERPDEQESVTSALHYCETITALRALHEGGTFIFKLFTIFEHSTVNLLYLLTCLFNDVNICKPLTSKQGNSEVYAVCLGYHGIDKLKMHMPILLSAFGTKLYTEKSLFPQTEIDTKFLNQVHSCSKFFSSMQCEVINNNLYTFLEPSGTPFCIKQLRQNVAQIFLQHYNIQPIAEEFEILKGELHKKPLIYVHTNKDAHKGSHTQRSKYDEMNLSDKLHCFHNALRGLLFEMKDNKMFLLDNMSLELYTKEELQLNMTIGKPIQVLCSSTFIYTKMLNLYFKILKVNGCVKNIDCLNNVKNDFCHVVSFPEYDHDELYDLFEKKCFKLLYEKLLRMEMHDNLILINMNLLTHFNVSIINILSKNCFRSITFMESRIELKSFINCKKITELKNHLDKISDIKTVLSALPVNVTNVGDLYEIIVLYNNTVYRQKCKNILMENKTS